MGVKSPPTIDVQCKGYATHEFHQLLTAIIAIKNLTDRLRRYIVYVLDTPSSPIHKTSVAVHLDNDWTYIQHVLFTLDISLGVVQVCKTFSFVTKKLLIYQGTFDDFFSRLTPQSIDTFKKGYRETHINAVHMLHSCVGIDLIKELYICSRQPSSSVVMDTQPPYRSYVLQNTKCNSCLLAYVKRSEKAIKILYVHTRALNSSFNHISPYPFEASAALGLKENRKSSDRGVRSGGRFLMYTLNCKAIVLVATRDAPLSWIGVTSTCINKSASTSAVKGLIRMEDGQAHKRQFTTMISLA